MLIYPEVKLVSTQGTARGDLYLDDGENNNYLMNERTQVQFDWANSQLTVMKTLTDDNQYPKASGKFINKAQIFNVAAAPDHVRNSYVSDMDGQIETNIDFIYNDEEQSLTLHNFFIPVDSAVYMEPVVLWEIFWV